MLEHQIRCAIYARKGLKPGSKLALLGVLACVDWQTWSGPCSSQDVAKRMGMDARTVRRAFKNLVELNLIHRLAERRETANGKGHHHRAQTTLNVKLIMSGVTLGQNDLTPLGQNDLTPLGQNDLTPLGQNDLHINHGYSIEDINQNTTEDTQQTSQPVQDAETSAAVVAVEVNDEIPPELSGFSPEYINGLKEYAALDRCSLIEAHEYQQLFASNQEKKLAWRRKHEQSGNHNRPTAAYRPKPLY